MKFEDIKKLHQKKFREKLKHFVIEGEHLVQELEKAATRDARLRESKIFVTRDYAHWSSKLPMHVDPVQAHGADQRDAFAAGHRRGGAVARARRAARG